MSDLLVLFRERRNDLDSSTRATYLTASIIYLMNVVISMILSCTLHVEFLCYTRVQVQSKDVNPRAVEQANLHVSSGARANHNETLLHQPSLLTSCILYHFGGSVRRRNFESCLLSNPRLLDSSMVCFGH